MGTMRLEKFDPALFLQEYWQKKPLLIRGALPDFVDPLSPDELAGLSLEQEIESRLISNHDNPDQWQLQHGPFTEADFLRPDHNWTLLVQAVDHHLPELHELLKAFRFIPDWRIDDIMVSYASDRGSVGPHYDNYDVFLIQGLGQRRWQIGQHCDQNQLMLEHTELKILSNFQLEQEYLLEPGDILYVPPRIAHWGTAIGEAMTYSVGFRAPSHSELISHWSDYLLSKNNDDRHLSDSGIGLNQHPAEISSAALDHLKSVMKHLLDHPQAMEDWFAKLVTEPKYTETEQASDNKLSASEINTLLSENDQIFRSPDCRLAFIRRENHLDLYANGEALDSSTATIEFIEYLCIETSLACEQLLMFCNEQENLKVLTKLISRNHLNAE